LLLQVVVVHITVVLAGRQEVVAVQAVFAAGL
jgi:hypothetical protein